MSDNIKVVVKVRPLISREIEEKLSYQWRVKNNTLYQLDQNGKENGACFTFDKVYDTETKICDIYNDIAKPIVEAATAGFNGTIFAYGQTSSGKTYTMTGTEDTPGIIPLAVYDMFKIIKNIPDRDFLVRVSYIEIYNETLKDLLNVDKKAIKIFETLQGGVKVDCTEQVTTSPDEVLKYLKEGKANRQTGATNMNEESSRSHSIFQITIESREHIEGEEEAGCVNVSQLNLVDLAGSERAGQTGATGQRFKEGTHINKSLSSLALVIKQLSEDQNRHVNYRDSKLTRILQNSLGGNAKTSIICAITPAAVEETISTLQFANRAKAIKNKPEVNAVATNATMIQSLTKQLSKLQSQLESKKNLEVMLESKKHTEHNLQKRIAALQRLILNGFETRSSMDMMAERRRKLVPPRRVTISTLHPIDEDPVPTVPKFHTPLLKYNPMVTPGSNDFLPIQNASKLTSLPEEGENRMITPPPLGRKITVNDEIIDLDSDDDDSCPDVQTCSPYHKCYGSSKTPPCVLRKNAKLAEKNFKDIVELTEREKMYTPSVVELIEKLEQNTSVIARLEDEVNALNRRSKEKDLEIDVLKVKVTKSNEEIKTVNSAKVELEAICKEYTTKITDLEVSYETLKAKTKRREDELLSLLNEQNRHKHIDTSKLIEKELNFMDMSKDISLVNSDNESSMTNDDEPTAQVQDLVIEMQSQLTHRNENVLELEKDILAHKQKILSLENSSRELQAVICGLKDKVGLLENENSLLKSTIDTLNSTINSQKSSLESATNDIESYNSLIQELQIKLTDKEKITNLNINENTLEKMIANEEKFIANNENMKNIIYSFKIALESRNKEIETLKSANVTHSPDNNDLHEQLSLKEKEIHILNEKAQGLQEKINEQVSLIDKLIQERTNLKEVESQLTGELTSITNQYNELEKINSERDAREDSLKKNNEELIQSISDKDNIEKELLKKHESLSQNIDQLSQQVLDLQEDIRIKDKLITSLNTHDTLSQEYILNAKSVLNILHGIVLKFGGNVQEIPDQLNNLNDILDTLKNNLESTLLDTITQKDDEIQSYLQLKTNLENSNKSLEMEVKNLKLNVEDFSNTIQDYKMIKDELNALTCERDDLLKELESNGNIINDLQTNVVNADEKNKNLSNDILDKDNTILSLKEKEKDLQSEIVKMRQEKEQTASEFQKQMTIMKDFEMKEKYYVDILHEKDAKIDHLENTVTQIEKQQLENSEETENLRLKSNETIEHRNSLIDKILQQVLRLASSLNIEFISNSNISVSENIDTLLNAIEKSVNRKNSEENYSEELVSARNKLITLGEQNYELSNSVTELDSTNKTLISKMEQIQLENHTLNESLNQSNNVLETLKMELKQKVNEIENMVSKTQGLKDHFSDLDAVMKAQMKELQSDNDKLIARCTELEIDLNNREYDILAENSDTENKSKSIGVRYSNESVTENISPPSLLKICCDKIVSVIQPSENSLSSSDSNTSTDCINNETQLTQCECDNLRAELIVAESENLKLSRALKQLESLNQHLISEQDQVRQEVQLLLEPAYELQKKISNHKTNLSTLTATTYAENKSLRSQVKVLQHHHNRFHKVCQRDLPVVKKQLHELMTILRGENSSGHNVSFKRYSLPSVLLDNNSTMNTLKNECTLDGDLLMLDTNLTLTTSADNTLMGLDQTCLDITQVYSNNDVGCQTYDFNNEQSQFDGHYDDSKKICEKIEALEAENRDLKQKLNSDVIARECIDAQSSPLKMFSNNVESRVCVECEEKKNKESSLREEIKLLSEKLSTISVQKEDIQKKYNDLALEIPSSEALLKRISIFEKELNGKIQEITQLTNHLSHKDQQLKQLQQENDTLSTQVFENISETDDLNKKLDDMNEAYEKLTEKCCNLEKLLQETVNDRDVKCAQCEVKDDITSSLQNVDPHAKLNRSLSDSDTSSRLNKICTLQNELHAGREDCKVLTEEVTVIKNHLERSNLSMGQNMDLDESIGEPNIFTFTKHFENVENHLNKFNAANPTQDRQMDIYSADKADCINYLVETTGANKENLDCNMKIIDVMKMFYTNCIMKHNNEVENFINKIRTFEDSRNELEIHVKELSSEYNSVTKKLEDVQHKFQTLSNTVSVIRQNINLIDEDKSMLEDNKNNQIVHIFKEKFLKIMDDEFGFTSVSVFDRLVDSLLTKHGNDLATVMSNYTELQAHIESVTTELNTVNNDLLDMKNKLSEKENECNLLKAQKEKIHEISNAVTLDIVKKEQELCKTIMSGCQKLVENNVISSPNFDMSLPLNSINLLFDHLINDFKKVNPNIEKEKELLSLEVKKSRTELEETQKAIETLKLENDQLKDINKSVTLDLVDKDSKLQIQNSVYEELNRKYEFLVEENKSVTALLDKKQEEVKVLKENLVEKESALQNIESNNKLQELHEKEEKLSELLNAVANSKQEIEYLKTINEVIIKEKQLAEAELENCRGLLKTNTSELEKMTSDILVLRESVKENVSIIESLKLEAKSMLQQNINLKEQFEQKCRDCSRLEMNIKTHEKTAEIQSKMIMRHQKQKEDDDKLITEKNKRLEELSQQISELQKGSETLRNNIKATKEELNDIKNVKEALELRLSQMELDLEKVNKPRLSVDGDTTRRRRQSIQDSKRMFSENQDMLDHNKMEAVFESRPKPADLFMDVDEDHSNRSTPLRNSKGRDSLVSRHDQSEEGSRPSSVAETRRRRQSTHDLHRSGVQQTPSPHERPSSKLSESTTWKSTDVGHDNMQSSEVTQLREKLSSCQRELEELKEQYRELDEECETCAQYLHERDDQCKALNKEKVALEKLVSELKDKLKSANQNRSLLEKKPVLCHAAVNTDEDWANLHSIVVDRMSFDAEVEKNKRLTKTIEDLRLRKQDLKNMIAKMQRAMEKSATKDYSKELEVAKLDLKACKQELKELKERYQELDEECETCSKYLQERDEQVRKLKEAKAALEVKLQEYSESRGAQLAQSLRKKRQSFHDQYRDSHDSSDAATQVGDDFLSNQVERDDNSRKNNDDKSKEIKRLKMAVENLSQQRAALQLQLAAAPSALCVATGSAIVQTQQLTDVMKENQKLKKINAKLIDICKKRGKKPEAASEDLSEHNTFGH